MRGLADITRNDQREQREQRERDIAQNQTHKAVIAEQQRKHAERCEARARANGQRYA